MFNQSSMRTQILCRIRNLFAQHTSAVDFQMYNAQVDFQSCIRSGSMYYPKIDKRNLNCRSDNVQLCRSLLLEFDLQS